MIAESSLSSLNASAESATRLRSADPVEPEERAESELERELAKRLRLGRAALPALPRIAEAALRLASDPSARSSELARLVDSDPPLAARFMAAANSVIYCRGWVANTTESAIVRLGLGCARDLLFQVVYTATANGLRRYQGAVQASLRRSLIAAHASRVISRELSIGSEYAYMSGLLHDMGESRVYRVLDTLGIPERSEQAVELVRKYHERAGAELALAWKLPSEIVDACATHHDRAAAATPHVRLVMLADCVAAALDTEVQSVQELELEAFDQLLLDPSSARRFIEKTRMLVDPRRKL